MTGFQTSEPLSAIEFKKWFIGRGGYLHPALHFAKNATGTSVYSRVDISSESTKILSCPFSLAIDFPLASAALRSLLGVAVELTEREAICSYIVLHWCTRDIDQEHSELQHWPYIASLPEAEQMTTPLFMREEELALLSGTNLYYASLDRKTGWQKEWERCRSVVRSSPHPEWVESFSWEVRGMALR